MKNAMVELLEPFVKQIYGKRVSHRNALEKIANIQRFIHPPGGLFDERRGSWGLYIREILDEYTKQNRQKLGINPLLTMGWGYDAELVPVLLAHVDKSKDMILGFREQDP